METAPSEHPGRLGPYVVEQEIGHGGMGAVYRARHDETGDTVAIKVLPPELGRSEGFRERFHREVRTLAALSHPNIVHFVDAGQQDGLAWYAMEFVPGRSLSAVLLERKRLPWDEAVDVTLQISHALKHAHDRGVIHRDLKLSNLIMTPEGQVKLTDFGIAKVFDLGPMTGTGGVVGTAEYMSPEQAEGKPTTRRSDLYSLGIVLYALVTGRLPFKGRTALDVMRLHRYAQFDRPSAIVPDLPADLDRLIGDLLAKDPAQRPADAYVTARRLDVIRRKAAYRAEVGSSSARADFFLANRGEGDSGWAGGDSSDVTRAMDNPTPALDVASGEDEIPGPPGSWGSPAASVAGAGRSPRLASSRARVDDLDRGDEPAAVADTGHIRERLTVAGLVLALLVLLGGLAWALWPPSDAALAARGEALLAANRAEDDLQARDTAFRPLLGRHPDGPWADLARRKLDEIAERARLRAARLQARTGLRVGEPTTAMTEPERFYLHGEALRQSGDLAGARARFAAVATLFDDDPSARSWVEAARGRLAEIDRRPAGPAARRRRDALERARRLAADGKPEQARALWSALIDLYGDDPEARSDVAEARLRLGDATGRAGAGQ